MRTTLTPAAVSTMTVTERLALDNLDTDAPSALRDRAFEIGRASALTLQPGWTPLFFNFGEIAKMIQPACRFSLFKRQGSRLVIWVR